MTDVRVTANRTINGLGTLIEWVVVLLVAVLVIVVFSNVVARYVLQSGLLWAEEVSRLIFVWAVFLGASVALRRKAHLAITFVTDRLPTTARTVVLTSVMLLVIAFLATITWAGAELVRQTVEFGRVTPILGISAAWGYLGVPVTAALMLLETARSVLTGEYLLDAEVTRVPSAAVAPDDNPGGPERQRVNPA